MYSPDIIFVYQLDFVESHTTTHIDVGDVRVREVDT